MVALQWSREDLRKGIPCTRLRLEGFRCAGHRNGISEEHRAAVEGGPLPGLPACPGVGEGPGCRVRLEGAGHPQEERVALGKWAGHSL